MYFDARGDENASESILRIPDAIDVDGEHALWRAVIKRTIRDAGSAHLVPLRHNAQWGVTSAEQAKARACLADVEWCEVMCERAGIDVEWFMKQRGMANLS